MKRRLLAALLLASMVMTGCMATTLEEKQEKEAKENKDGTGASKYTSIEDMDFASGHIEGMIKDNFKVDADVPVNVPTECGTYEIERYETGMTEEEYDKLFDEAIDNYFGSDVTTSDIDQKNATIDLIKNSSYYGGSGQYFKKPKVRPYEDYSSYHSKLKMIERTFYEYGFEYDREFTDDIVNKFLDKCANIIPDGMNGDYTCIHIDGEYYNDLLEKYSKEELEINWQKDGMDYYAISMYSEVEEDIYFKGFYQKFYNAIDGEIIDDVCVTEYIEEDSASSIISHNPQSVEMIVTEEGELVSVHIDNYYTIGEKLETNTILTAKEALECFGEKFDGVLLEEEMIVKSITLEYVVELSDKLDENGYRNAVLMPVWAIRYDSPLKYWPDTADKTMFLSAVDGSIYLDY